MGELGRTMRWSDLRAFVNHLPATSHFWRAEEPEEAARLAWVEGLATPQSLLLGELYDLVDWYIMARAGQQPNEPIVQRMSQRVMGERSRETGGKDAAPARRPRKSAAEIRAQLERAEQAT